MKRAWASLAVLVASVIVLAKSVELRPPVWLFITAVVLCAFAVLRWAPPRMQWRGVGLFALMAAGVVALYAIPWSRRERFICDLYSIEPGSSVEDVQHVMAGYMVGSGIPALDGSGREIGEPGAIIFRHSNEAAYNCEWGLVYVRDSRVTEVSLAYD